MSKLLKGAIKGDFHLQCLLFGLNKEKHNGGTRDLIWQNGVCTPHGTWWIGAHRRSPCINLGAFSWDADYYLDASTLVLWPL